MFNVATVQNLYNLVDRGSEDVLDYCEKHGIGFIPWYPLAAGRLAKSGSILDAVAKAHDATPSQIRARMGAQAQSRHAAHSGHVQGRASGRECRRRQYPAVG